MKFRALESLLLVLILAFPVAASRGFPQAAPEAITYTMPAGWAAQPVQGAGPEMKAHYAFYYQGTPCGEMYLYISPAPGNQTVDQVFQEGLAKIRPGLPYYQSRGLHNAVVDGLPTVVHEFSFVPTGSGVAFVVRTYTLIAGGSVHSFWFQTVPNYFQSVQAAFGQVMASVKAAPKPAPPINLVDAGGGGPAKGLTGDDLGLAFDLPAGWTLVNDPAGAKYRRFDADGSQSASLIIGRPDETAGLNTLFGAPDVSAAEDAVNNRIEREFKNLDGYRPRATAKRAIAGYAAVIHDFDFSVNGRPAFYRYCAFAVPRKSDKPSVVVAPEARNFSLIGFAPQRADEIRREWDGILDSMRVKGAPAPPAGPENAPGRNPAWAVPKPAPVSKPEARTDGGLPVLAEEPPPAGLFPDPFGRYTVKLPEAAVLQKTEDNAAWFGMPAAKTTFIVHNCPGDETVAALATRFAAGKKAGGTPTGLTVDGREATVSLYTARDADGESRAWVLAAYKGSGLLIVVSLPAKDYAGAQGWIGGLLRGVRFSAR
jgi:hypothetical protein